MQLISGRSKIFQFDLIFRPDLFDITSACCGSELEVLLGRFLLWVSVTTYHYTLWQKRYHLYQTKKEKKKIGIHFLKFQWPVFVRPVFPSGTTDSDHGKSDFREMSSLGLGCMIPRDCQHQECESLDPFVGCGPTNSWFRTQAIVKHKLRSRVN